MSGINKDMEFPGEDKVFYAGHLREMGCEISEEIPDCAWVPRWSLSMGEPNFKHDESNPDVVEMDMDIRITEPFRWLSVTLKIPAKNPLKKPI